MPGRGVPDAQSEESIERGQPAFTPRGGWILHLAHLGHHDRATLATKGIPPATWDFHARYFLATRSHRAPELWDGATGEPLGPLLRHPS